MNKKTVQDYQQIIQDAQYKIQEIQSTCNHPSSTPMMYSWRVGAFYPSLICDTCFAQVAGITQEQSDQLYKDFLPQGDFT